MMMVVRIGNIAPEAKEPPPSLRPSARAGSEATKRGGAGRGAGRSYLSIDRSIYLSIYLSIDLSIYRSIDLSIDRSIYLSPGAREPPEAMKRGGAGAPRLRNGAEPTK